MAVYESGSDASTESVAPVGVKLGSARTVVFSPGSDGEGVDVTRSLTCLATYEGVLGGEENVLYGETAAREFPDRARFMLRAGLPEDERGAALASTFFEELLAANDVPENSAVVYAIPTIDNEAGLRNLEAVLEDSPVGDALVRSYPESLCGALPAFGDGLDGLDDVFVAVNMGATTLEVSAYRHGEQLTPLTTGTVTGNDVDRCVANAVEAETQGRVNVDSTTAREYKEAHADFEEYEPFTDVVQQPGGGTHEFTIEHAVMDACDEYLDDVVESVAAEFLPRLATDHPSTYRTALRRPFVVTGGMACIPGIEAAFESRLGESIRRDVEVTSPERPALAAAEGAHEIATRLASGL